MLERYKLFNLVVDSMIPLPEAIMIQTDTPADVSVVFGHVDVEGFAPEYSVPWWQAMPTAEHIMFGCRAGVFEIKYGNRIVIDAEPDAPIEMVRVFLLGSAMGAIQIQRGRIPIHGGAIVSAGKAIILTGPQGSGKSTMTSALVHNGFYYLTDDVSSTEIWDGIPMVFPAYPQRKLVRDACLQLGYDPALLPVIDKDRDKFAVRDKERWYGDAVAAGMLIEMIPVSSGEPLRAVPIGAKERIELIFRSLYRLWMHVQEEQIPTTVFKKLLIIASVMEIYRVYVPRGIADISIIAEEFAGELGLRP